METESTRNMRLISGTSVSEFRLRRIRTEIWRIVCLWMLLVGFLHAEGSTKGNRSLRVINKFTRNLHKLCSITRVRSESPKHLALKQNFRQMPEIHFQS